MHGDQEMLIEIVHPGALDTRAQIEEDLTEMMEQLRKQLTRIRELRLKKIEEPGSTFFLLRIRLSLTGTAQIHSMASKMKFYKMLMS